MQGLGGYKIWLAVGLLLGEGAYIMGKAALLGKMHAPNMLESAIVVQFWLLYNLRSNVMYVPRRCNTGGTCQTVACALNQELAAHA
jgi:hypothetical protein